MRELRASFVLGVLVVAWVAISAAAWLGQAAPFFPMRDGFADFFKFVSALPGPPVAPDPAGFELSAIYSRSSDYHSGVIGFYHVPPFTMLLTQGLRAGFSLISPLGIGVALASAFVMALLTIVERETRNWTWAFVAALSYPAIYLLDRGNLFAALSGICLIAALLRQRPDWIGAALLAVAVNVRPNLALCALPLLFLDWGFTVKLGVLGLSLLGASFVAAHAIDPNYTVSTFLAGLRLYNDYTLAAGRGVAFGSSLWGAAAALGFPHRPALVSAIPLLLLLPALHAGATKRLSYGDFAFVCAAVSALSTPVFADYHLVIFIAPLLLEDASLAAVIASLLILLPKGYGEIDGATFQVILNPLILLAAASVALLAARARYASPDQSIVEVQEQIG